MNIPFNTLAVMATPGLMHLLLTNLLEEAIEFDRIKPLVIFWIA